MISAAIEKHLKKRYNMITQKIKTILTVAALGFAGQLFAAETAVKKPNVMFIFADDQATIEYVGTDITDLSRNMKIRHTYKNSVK